jgi:hypothetical protein
MPTGKKDRIDSYRKILFWILVIFALACIIYKIVLVTTNSDGPFLSAPPLGEPIFKPMGKIFPPPEPYYPPGQTDPLKRNMERPY